LYEDAITWTTDGANAGDVNFRKGKFYCTNVCGVLISKDGFANPCVAALINSVSRKHVSYVGNPKLMNGVMSKIKIPFPKLKEQQKIATCLSSLDEVITAEGKKLEALKEHKKGLLQNLFPQEGETVPKLRFPEFENSGEWVEKTLGEMSENVMYGMNAAAVEFDGENKYIRITDIDENTRLFSPNPLTSPDGQLDDKYFLKVGDILFARTGASVGKSYLHQKENGRVYFAGFLIRFTIKNAIPYFIYLQTLTEQYQKWVSKTSMRSGQPGINAEEYKSYSIYLPPTIKEQQKIADCLSSLDEFITAQTQKIELLQMHKKGLLQGLFPNINEQNG
jgi:type I restriction enzyme S subunit